MKLVLLLFSYFCTDHAYLMVTILILFKVFVMAIVGGKICHKLCKINATRVIHAFVTFNFMKYNHALTAL